jgi:predicted metal-dependent phosphoesterase TrpH
MALNAVFKADFHLHTKEDPYDKKVVKHSSEELIERAASLGFEVLCITNHNHITYSPYLREYAKMRGILLMPGTEVTIESKHVLLINYLGPLDFKKVADLARLKNTKTVVIAAHPFFPGSTTLKKKLLKNIDVFDAIEYCHFYRRFINFNRKAVLASREHKKPMVGTSDAHALEQMNFTYSMVEAQSKTSDAIVLALKQGRVKVVTRPIPLPILFRVLARFGIGATKLVRIFFGSS